MSDDRMEFRIAKASIVNNVLGPAENNRFQTIGFQRQTKAAEEIANNLRMVTVYYGSGTIPKSSGSGRGPVMHDTVFNIGLIVAAAASMDLTILDRDGVTSSEIAAAIRNSQEATDKADDSMDDLIQIVYQILMDARNRDLGLSPGEVANRWVDQIQKQQPVPQGEYVVLTASMRLTCRVAESIVGDPGVVATEGNETVIDLEGDNNEKTGITVK